MKALCQLWDKTPNPPSPTQGFIAGHDNIFCGKFSTGYPPKTCNLLALGAGGRGDTESKNLNNTSPATTQNLSNLWASTKGNYLHPRQTQHKQGRLAGQPQPCVQQPLLGWFWTPDSQTSNSFQQSEHKSVAWKGREFQVMPTDLMIRSITRWRLWIWNFTKTLHGIGSPLTRKMPPLNALFKRVWEADLKCIAWS